MKSHYHSKDYDRGVRDTTRKLLHEIEYMLEFTLSDKFKFTPGQLSEFSASFNELFHSISEGYLEFDDLVAEGAAEFPRKRVTNEAGKSAVLHADPSKVDPQKFFEQLQKLSASAVDKAAELAGVDIEPYPGNTVISDEFVDLLLGALSTRYGDILEPLLYLTAKKIRPVQELTKVAEEE